MKYVCDVEDLFCLIKIHGEYSISPDGETWYTQVCKFLKLDHHLLIHLRKALLKELLYSVIMAKPKAYKILSI